MKTSQTVKRLRNKAFISNRTTNSLHILHQVQSCRISSHSLIFVSCPHLTCKAFTSVSIEKLRLHRNTTYTSSLNRKKNQKHNGVTGLHIKSV